MTAQPELRRTYPFDLDRAVESLSQRAFTRVQVGGGWVDLLSEPLLRRAADASGDAASREQPIRVRSEHTVTRAVVSIAGRAVEVVGEPLNGGVRFFVPAVSATTPTTISFPELGGEPVPFDLRPVREWELSLVPHSHFDIGYTDLQGEVILQQLSYLDSALRYAEADAAAVASGEASDRAHAFRWTVESIWVLKEWIARRTPAAVDRFMAQVRAGRIELAALPFNVSTEVTSTEELHGLLRYGQRIAAEYDLEIPVAYQTDIPGAAGGIVDALAASGVKYLSVAHNWAGKAVPYLHGDAGLNLPRLFWWQSPAGERVLVWMTTTAQGCAYQEGANLGLPDNIETAEDRLPLFLNNEELFGAAYDDNSFGYGPGLGELERDPYPWKQMSLRVMSRIADNGPFARRLPEVVEAWNERWEFPKLRISSTADYFEQMIAEHGDEIQTFTGDWNSWWADGAGSSARGSQLARRAQNLLSQIGTVGALLKDDSSPDFGNRLEQAWETTELFDEHTWGSALPWMVSDTTQQSGQDQWAWKYEKALRADHDAEFLRQEVLRAFADERGGTGDASIWVVNTEGYARGGRVRVFLPESLVHTTATVRLTVDGGPNLAFIEVNQTNPNHREAGRFLEFEAPSVPALGAIRVDVSVLDPNGRASAPDGTVAVVASTEDPRWTLDNGIVRVRLNPKLGSIASIVRLADGAELVNEASAFGFNAYVHDEYLARGELAHVSGFVYDFGPDLVLLGDRNTPTHSAFEDAGSNEVEQWVRVRIFGTGVNWITTTVRLRHGASFVDIENRVSKPFTTESEAGFFAFPFAVGAADAAPTVRFEVPGAVAGTGIPTVPGGCDYMFGARDWVTVQSGDQAAALVTADVPLVQIGDIALAYPPYTGTLKRPEPSTIFSWLHNNNWDTNFPSGQAWETTFRYRVEAFTAANPEAAAVHASRLAAELVRPLLGVAADPTPTVQDVPGLVSLSDDRVRVLSASRTANELLVRLQSLAESAIEVEITVASPVAGATRATLTGVAGDSVTVRDGRSVRLQLGRFGTTAVAFQLG
ncbi:MAG TPA: hypothetical protein VFU07_09140 [Candidatus Lumbricidophila sp.]|nr:hypothetical protein [Candidatus Lumbricidophila sp.]